MEGFLEIKIAPWQRVALTRSIALGPALLVALIGSGTGGEDSGSGIADTCDPVSIENDERN